MNATGNIEREEPKDHWGMLIVRGRIVLDLGCGRTYQQEITTPEYFLNSGASRVIGVELQENEKKWFDRNVTDSRLLVITDKVDTAEKLMFYVDAYCPDVIKCDIEGDEKILEDFDFTGIGEIAIEYHSPEMKKMIEENFSRWGFDKIELFSMNLFDFQKQGVIYLVKL